MGPKKVAANAVEYPPDCKEVSTELSRDELHRRLKVTFLCLQNNQMLLVTVLWCLLYNKWLRFSVWTVIIQLNDLTVGSMFTFT